jgi:FAD/FMN-containing dehydrogenase/Fe-S oxidoreductase
MPLSDQQRQIIQDDLRGLIEGDVRCDDISLQLFASDASIYEIKPLGIVRPRSTADVVACVQYAAEKQIPIHARGAGTGMAGESLGPGLVIDFSRYLRRVIHTQPDRVRVQSGIVLERLNSHLRNRGRLFGPDPAKGNMTTLGGMLAVDAAGSRRLKYGSTREHVLSLQVVLADGQVLEVGHESLIGSPASPAGQRKQQIVSALAHLLADHKEAIARNRPKSAVNRCGYQMWDVLSEGHLDLARLLVGSEGTLALITEAELSTEALPRHRGVALLLFDSLEKACRAAQESLQHSPSACDLMDRRHLSLARESEVRFDLLIPPDTEAVLLVEQEGNEQFEVRSRLHRVVDEIWHRLGLAFGARLAFEAAETDLFWQLSRKIQPALHRVKGPTRPVPVVEDIAVPLDLLPDFLVRMQNVLKKLQVTASLFSHAGQGQVHIQPFLDLTQAADVERMQRLAEDLYEQVLSLGGSISGEHACGLSRTAYVRRQYGDSYEVLREIKRLFDPQNLLNPGKVVGDDPNLIVGNLRPAVTVDPPELVESTANGDPPRLRNLLELQLNWNPAQVVDICRSCNGCGECRSQSSDVRMCPIFRTLPAEEASPRAKANLIRGVLTGRMPLGSLTSDEFKSVADLCVNCHMCALECPARVDIPRLMIEAKAAYVAANGLDLSDWVTSRVDWFSALASRASRLVNWALASRQMRWLMEKTLGIAQGRKLPRVAARSFLRRAARRRLSKPSRRSGQKVAYFVDTYANYHDPQLAEALVAVLEHNGISVYVPPDQKQSGAAALACGDLDQARRIARHNLTILAEAVRQGYHVITAEPAAAVCLTREYGYLFDDDDVRQVAQNTSEACTYLWRMHTTGKLQLDLRPINATLGYHMPCRLKALEVGAPGEYLLRLIPGLTVIHCEEGCSGMAGTYGMKRKNYRASLRAGWDLINRLRGPDIQIGTTECSTCKMQMEQGTTKPTIHPLKLLALSYGLLPEAAHLLTASSEELIVT